jgi:hypothetical protein
MICCTNLEVWSTTVDGIKMERGEDIISIIKNLICHVLVEVTDLEARGIIIEGVLRSFWEQVKKCALDFPLRQPLLRSNHKWYTDGHENLCRIFSHSI